MEMNRARKVKGKSSRLASNESSLYTFVARGISRWFIFEEFRVE